MYTEHKKTACRYCGQMYDVANIAKHEKACSDPNSKLNQKRLRQELEIKNTRPEGAELVCIYCGRLCKNQNSLAQHEIRCKENPDRRAYDQLTRYILENVKGHTAEEVPHIKKQAETMRQYYKEGKRAVTCIQYVTDPAEYVHQEHNQHEIDKWISYVRQLNPNIPKYETGIHNQGYNVVKKLYERDHTSVKIILEHNYLANIYLQGNLKKENAVHHLNRIRNDNTIENLIVFISESDHKRYHSSKNAYLSYDENTHLFSCCLKNPE